MSRQQKRKVGKSCPEPPSGIETHPTVVALQAAATKLTKAVEAEIFFSFRKQALAISYQLSRFEPVRIAFGISTRRV